MKDVRLSHLLYDSGHLFFLPLRVPGSRAPHGAAQRSRPHTNKNLTPRVLRVCCTSRCWRCAALHTRVPRYPFSPIEQRQPARSPPARFPSSQNDNATPSPSSTEKEEKKTPFSSEIMAAPLQSLQVSPFSLPPHPQQRPQQQRQPWGSSPNWELTARRTHARTHIGRHRAHHPQPAVP